MTASGQPISEDTLARLRDIITRATAAGHHDVAAQAADWLDRAIRHNATQAATAGRRGQSSDANPMSYARARVGEPPRKRPLRKGKSQCTGTRRDGERCQAPASAGGVCKLHGGAAPQTRIAEGLRMRQVEALDAIEQWQARRDIDSLGKVSRAERELESYEAKLDRLRELRRQLRRVEGTEHTG